MDAPERAVMGVPGKGECRGSRRACARLDGTSGAGLWPARALQGRGRRFATACNDEQRRMARPARCDRVHSALTQQVSVIEAVKVSVHAGYPRMTSGQLPFLG